MDGELASYFMEEFGCEYSEIVDEHGFVYSKDEDYVSFVQVDDIIPIKTPYHLIFKEMLLAFTRDEKIKVINKYQEE